MSRGGARQGPGRGAAAALWTTAWLGAWLGGWGVVATVPWLALTACTEAHLEPIPLAPTYRDDKLSLEGELCTQVPASLVFPLRVLFVVDASESMAVTDPPDPVTGETARERAVRETWTDLLSQGAEDVRVGIIRFSSQAQSRTPVDLDGDSVPDSYFTSDATQLDFATTALSTTDRTTNYVNALSEAYFEMRTELSRADLESLPLSKYVVVFLSDGLPDVDDQEAAGASDANILAAVSHLRELADLFHVGDFSFHTAYLSAGQGPAVDQPAQELLQKMAQRGGGTYRSFPNGEELNFLFVDLSIIRRVFTLRSLTAVNLNTVVDYDQARSFEVGVPPELALDLNHDGVVGCGEPMVDSDGDGLADVVEGFFGSDPLNRDTDDDGLNDRIEWDLSRTSGEDGFAFDPNDPSDAGCLVLSPCIDDDEDGFCDCRLDFDTDGVCNCVTDPETPCADDLGHDCVDEDADGWCDCPDVDHDGRCDYADSDGDGLHDCEELYLGSAQRGVDSDADGLPDPEEARAGTSPVEADAEQDLDYDATLNGTEVAGGTDPLCEDAAFRSRVAYRYTTETLGIFGAQTCYRFEIDNITLGSTAPNLETIAGALGPDGIPYAVSQWPGNGWNRILVFAGEVSFDDPTSFARYRVACVEASYQWFGDFKNPPSGRMRLTEDDFVDVGDFDPAVHCKRPGQ